MVSRYATFTSANANPNHSIPRRAFIFYAEALTRPLGLDPTIKNPVSIKDHAMNQRLVIITYEFQRLAAALRGCEI